MNELPPITFANGDRVPAHARTAPSGVERIMFGENADKPMARLSYARLGKKACFAGMLFRDAPSDYRAGTSMLEYFFEEVTPALGLEPGTTSVIRKPIIALLLAKYGLEPDVTSETWSHVGLLVKRGTTSRNHPALHFVKGNESEFNDDRYRRYYDIVPNGELPYMYPLASPSRRVDMHTSYTP
jgi:hypothetical protein